MQQAVGAAAHQLDAVLAGRVVHHHLVVAAAAVFLRAMAGQDAVAVPLRLDRAVINAVQHDRPVAVAAHMADDHFLAHARHVNAAVAAARVGLRHAHPARGALVTVVEAVPDEAHLHAVELVGIDLLARRPDHDRRLQMHLGLVVLERAAVRHRHALRLELGDEEALAAVGMADRVRGAAVGGLRGVDARFQAVREAGLVVRQRQVVLDVARDADRRELALAGRVAIVNRMVGEREAPPRVDPVHAARAVEALGARFPLLELQLREVIAAILVEVGVGARVVIDLELRRQVALVGARGQRRALRVRGRRGRLVVERARGVRDALQRARARPLGQRVRLAGGARAPERERVRHQLVERMEIVGDHQRV